MKRLRSLWSRTRSGAPEAPLVDPSADYPISQFDNVRVASTDETTLRGYAGRAGVCYGFTTPSVTNVAVIGSLVNDVAFNVHFEDEGLEDAWFAPDLLEFMDHGEGTTISIGDKSFIRQVNSSWEKPDAGDSD